VEQLFHPLYLSAANTTAPNKLIKKGGYKMEVELVEVQKQQAEQEWKNYLEACKKEASPYYNKMKSVYYRLKQGYQILDAGGAIKKAGLNEKKEPKFAIARADMKMVAFIKEWNSGYAFVEVTKQRWGNSIESYKKVFVLGNVFQDVKVDIKTIVPKVPPQHLPEKDLENYHVLWEVESWKDIPKDPILLKRVTKNLFVFLAKWNLTKLEGMVLKEFII